MTQQVPIADTQKEPLFLGFFYLLRQSGLTVSSREWLVFVEALSKGLAAADLYRFYALARATLIKSEQDYDLFDQCFTHYFLPFKTFLSFLA